MLTDVLSADAATLRVSPAQFILHDIEPGREYDVHKETGVRFSIYNDDTVSRTWVLTTHRPSERGRWETGYTEIPDPGWCWFSDNEITVDPNSVGYGYLFVKVPGEAQYFNQHWMTTVSVTGKSGAGNVSLAVDVRVGIETKSVDSVAARPAGKLGMVPSTAVFSAVVPGETSKSSVRIYNNSDEPRIFGVNSLFADPKFEPKTYLVAGRQLLPSRDWLQYAPSFEIGPRGIYALQVELRVPAQTDRIGKKWEDCLLVQSEDGLLGFIRVRVDMVDTTAPAER